MANKKISQLTAVASVSDNDVFPVVQGAATLKAKISDIKAYLPQASSTLTGLLTNTDWSTFNNKQNALTLGNLTESTSSVLTITGGTGSIIGSGLTIQVKQASASQSGYLSSTDWSTFNSKQGSLTLTTTGTSGAATLVGTTLNIPQYPGNALTSLNGQTGAIQTFSTGTTGTDFSISSVANDHKFSFPSASASARGLLTSADWSTFNSKEPALTKGNLTETTSSVLTITGGTGAVIGSGLTIAVTRSTALADGYLKASDFSTFAAKQDAITLTTTGSSGAATLVGSTLNIPQYSGGSGVTSVTGSNPIASSGGATPDISIANAKADGSTKGAAAFRASDFDDDGAGLISIDYTNGNSASSGGKGFLTAADWSTFNGKQDTANDIYAAWNALGSGFLGMNCSVPNNLVTSGIGLTNQRLQFAAYYIPKATTITGVKWYQNTQGNYTANNYNGVGLYTYSSGTLTLVASSTDDGNIWKAAASGWRSKAFSSTYSASKGIHFIGYLYCSSAQTTAPALGSSTGYSSSSVVFDFTNSARILGYVGSQTSLPATQATSGLTSEGNTFVIHLY